MKKPEELFRIIEFYKTAELIAVAVQLDIFRLLTLPKSEDDIAFAIGVLPEKTGLLLDGLVAVNLIKKKRGRFFNTTFADIYLNSASKEYIGDYYLLWMNKDDFQNLNDILRKDAKNLMSLDNQIEVFKRLAYVAAKEIQLKRSMYLIEAIKRMNFGQKSFSILDLGGGSGMLSIDVLSSYPSAVATVFDKESILQVSLEIARKKRVENRLQVRAGDFLQDDIGQGYDLIIASGIMDFAVERLPEFIEKLHNALTGGGYLYLVTCGFNKTLTRPQQAVLNWLPRRLKGINRVVTQAQIEKEIKLQNLEKVSARTIGSISQKFLEQIYKKT